MILSHRWFFAGRCTAPLLLIILSAAMTPGKDLQWKKHVLNEQSDYEAAGIGDLNGDGAPDIVCGAYWYEGPDWTSRHLIGEIEKSGTYYNDFANELQDVDGDGDLDEISATWFSQEVLWRENPGKEDQTWNVHSIDKPGNMETLMLMDLNHDGRDDLLPNCMQAVVWYEKDSSPASTAKWTKHVAARNGGHGVGAGDLNGDGRVDILCPNGWYEAPRSDSADEWTWHSEWNLGTASVPILAYDVNEDGRMDVVWGMGHNYGIYWLEQQELEGQRTWMRHTIDTRWSQPHYIYAADLDQDHHLDLITGKRYHAHDGKDPGAEDPLGIYVYQYDKEKGTWKRSAVDEGSRAGFGLHPAIGDVDVDGDLDLVCPGKSGLYLFEQQ